MIQEITKQVESAQTEKKPYVRPEVVEHGTVEQITQTVLIGGPSHVTY